MAHETFRTVIFVPADPLLPIRILVIVALIAMIFTFLHVLRHLRKIRRTVARDDLVPRELAARDNIIVCAVPLIVASLLLFLVETA